MNPNSNNQHTIGNLTYATIAKKGNVPLYEKIKPVRRYENDQNHKQVSVIGWITGSESKQARILSVGSSDLKLGCSLQEFRDEWELKAEEILDIFGDISMNPEMDWKRKILFIKFKNKEDVLKAKEVEIKI
ncbi:hypothetical protein AYI70_g3838 [Smittium culicis]|uniref:Uncharacterized protein n=1 Tax=Smittium culicis TaxID=133412 RepID=A0A1R1WXS9_9FUNG|nr:hypothetical protein AYI70_g12349 [Smittium culicis]OMJ20852.1 hypothetical protein AYI70_g3838 [Smittium culicis]